MKKILLIFLFSFSVNYFNFTYVFAQTKNIKVKIDKKQNTAQVEKDISKKDDFTYTEPAIPSRGYSFFSFIKSIFSLGIIIVLIYLSVYALKVIFTKKSFFSNSQNIKIIESFYLSPQKILYLIVVANKIFLIASSEKGMDLLLEIQDEESKKLIFSANTATVSTENIFENVLNKFQKKYKAQEDIEPKKNNDNDLMQDLKQDIERLKKLND